MSIATYRPALLAAALFATVSPAALAMELPVTWGYVSLGFPATSLRLQIGDPLRVLTFKDGTRRVARYWIPGGNSTYYLVTEERGYIAGLDIFTNSAPTEVLQNVAPDPSGIRLGDTLDRVKAKHADFTVRSGENGEPLIFGKISDRTVAAYSFENGRVFRMNWVNTALRSDLPELVPLKDPPGDSFASAIADVQQNEADGISWEYRYLAFHPCADGDDGRWKLQNQSLLHANGRAYDRLHVVCPATKAERDFYFDISSYFGKM